VTKLVEHNADMPMKVEPVKHTNAVTTKMHKYNLIQRQFYKSALNDHENAFRNITKMHEKSVRKRTEKVYKNASI